MFDTYYYSCDGGSLAIGHDNCVCQFDNGYGDGGFEVSVSDERGSEEDFPHFVGVIRGTDLNVYKYDCDTEPHFGDKSGVATVLKGYGRYGIFNDGAGNMLIQKWD